MNDESLLMVMPQQEDTYLSHIDKGLGLPHWAVGPAGTLGPVVSASMIMHLTRSLYDRLRLEQRAFLPVAS